jgi:hypothetical protein
MLAEAEAEQVFKDLVDLQELVAQAAEEMAVLQEQLIPAVGAAEANTAEAAEAEALAL